MPREYTPKFIINISEEQAQRMRALLPYGMKTNIFSKLIDQVIEIAETSGAEGLGAILDGDIALRYREDEENGTH
jgi:hypothetical protein